MSPYRVQYNESEYDIKNNNFLYKNIKNDKTFSNTSIIVCFWENQKNITFSKQKLIFILYYVQVP